MIPLEYLSPEILRIEWTYKIYTASYSTGSATTQAEVIAALEAAYEEGDEVTSDLVISTARVTLSGSSLVDNWQLYHGDEILTGGLSDSLHVSLVSGGSGGGSGTARKRVITGLQRMASAVPCAVVFRIERRNEANTVIGTETTSAVVLLDGEPHTIETVVKCVEPATARLYFAVKAPFYG
jgi:hypothetical protein